MFSRMWISSGISRLVQDVLSADAGRIPGALTGAPLHLAVSKCSEVKGWLGLQHGPLFQPLAGVPTNAKTDEGGQNQKGAIVTQSSICIYLFRIHINWQ